MLPLPALRALSRFVPDLASGRTLHRRALVALEAGDASTAELWFEFAAESYRGELAVEPLARLRVHQLMARAGATGSQSGDATAVLEIVRRLNRLDRLETLCAPFELADARTVLAQWIQRSDEVPAAGSYLQPAVAPAA